MKSLIKMCSINIFQITRQSHEKIFEFLKIVAIDSKFKFRIQYKKSELSLIVPTINVLNFNTNNIQVHQDAFTIKL